MAPNFSSQNVSAPFPGATVVGSTVGRFRVSFSHASSNTRILMVTTGFNIHSIAKHRRIQPVDPA